MTKSQKAKKSFITECQKLMGPPDAYGHFKVSIFRFKIQKTVWRFERHVGGQWKKVRGHYFTSGVSLTDMLTCVKCYVPQEARLAAIAQNKEA